MVHSSIHLASTWAAMTVAMMLPTVVPLVRYVAFSSRQGRRQRSVLAFAAGYVAPWLGVGLVVAVLLRLTSPVTPPAVAALALAAGLWELTPLKRRALRRCHRTRPVRYQGRAADLSCVAFGWWHGKTCVQVGGPAMVALMATAHPPAATIGVALAMLAQKTLRQAERWRAQTALSGVVAGLVILFSV